MKRMTWVIGLAALAVGAGLGTAWLKDAGSTSLLRPDDPAVTALGERVYRSHCASCHGARLEGQPDWRTRSAEGLLPAPPHDASGHTWHHPDAVLVRITKEGVAAVIGQPDYRTAMPAYANVLTDAEIVAVLSWIKAQWPAAIRQRHDQINAGHQASAR